MAGAKKVKVKIKGAGPKPKQHSALDENNLSKGQMIARDARLHRGYSQLLGGGYTRTSSRPYPKSAKSGALGLPQSTVDAIKAGAGIVGGATGAMTVRNFIVSGFGGGGGGGKTGNKTK